MIIYLKNFSRLTNAKRERERLAGKNDHNDVSNLLPVEETTTRELMESYLDYVEWCKNEKAREVE